MISGMRIEFRESSKSERVGIFGVGSRLGLQNSGERGLV